MLRRISFLLALPLVLLSVNHASAQMTVPCNASGCTATITPASGAAPYTLMTSDDGANFYSIFTSSSSTALDFANIYFDTDAQKIGGSNLGFEITNNRAFIPGVNGVYYSLAGTGITFTDTFTNGTRTIEQIIPNSFFLTDPTNIPFQTTTPGDLVTVHYSQAFGYDFIGGSNNYTLPYELGGGVVGSAASVTPEPASLQYMALAGLSAAGAALRKLRARK